MWKVERLFTRWLISGCFTSIWLWLYAGSGFLLRAARRFDIGFDWFNRKFDIEEKPLSAIGLVAGAVVAVIWWGAVVACMSFEALSIRDKRLMDENHEQTMAELAAVVVRDTYVVCANA